MADSRSVAVAGEVLTDLVPVGDALFRAAPGGSPANVAVGLARLGVPTRMLARLAEDALGRRLRRHLQRNGVDLTFAVPASEASSLAIVTVNEDGSASYDFRVDGTADWQWTDAELQPGLGDAVCALSVGSLAMIIEPGASALRRLVERARATTTICFDPNLRPLLMGPRDLVQQSVEELLLTADVIKASAEDVEWLYPHIPLDQIAASWLATGPSLVAITRGADGVLAAASAVGRLVRLPGLPVEVVDTVGAGDSFMSALIAGLYRRNALGAAERQTLRQLPEAILIEVLDEALRASAMTCTREGADPPTADELNGQN